MKIIAITILTAYIIFIAYCFKAEYKKFIRDGWLNKKLSK